MIIVEVIYSWRSLYNGHPNRLHLCRHKLFSLFQVIEFAEECLILGQQCCEYHFQVYRLVLTTIGTCSIDLESWCSDHPSFFYSMGLQDGEKTIEHFFKFTIAVSAEFTEYLLVSQNITSLSNSSLYSSTLLVWKLLPQEGYQHV